MAKGTCSVCAAPPAVQSAINEQLERRIPLRKIAAESAFSRASLSRHARACISRRLVSEHRSLIGDVTSGKARLILAQPHAAIYLKDGRPTMTLDTSTLVYAPLFGNGPIIPENELLDSDVIFQVEYEKPVDLVARAAEVRAAKAETEAREQAEIAEAEAALKSAEIPTKTTPN
jgi:hypothetical protein